MVNGIDEQTRVIFLSSGPLGEPLLAWLREQPCTIVLARTDGAAVGEFPECDLGLAFLYTHRIPATEVRQPHRWVNFHPGPLPDFRGRNLAYHAILEGSPTFGATAHYMDADFDTGEIIETERFPIEAGHTAGDLVRLAHRTLAGLFKRHVPALLRGKVPSTAQGDGRYFRRRSIDDRIEVTDEQARRIRAVTVHPRHHARVVVGGRTYRLIPDDDPDAQEEERT
jgi:methionyl-tRNA formyltransferase